jgi:hypothetical protein
VSYDDVKNRQIQISVAVNAAATLAAKTDNPIGNFGAYLKDVVDGVLGVYVENAVEDILPGTTDVTGTPAAVPPAAPYIPPVQQAYVPPPVQTAAPAPVPGAQDGDPQVAAYWQQFFNDPTAWHDNRIGKKNPKSPDFRSKSIPDPSNPQYKVSLWINDKGNPSWVKPALQQRGLAA